MCDFYFVLASLRITLRNGNRMKTEQLSLSLIDAAARTCTNEAEGRQSDCPGSYRPPEETEAGFTWAAYRRRRGTCLYTE